MKNILLLLLLIISGLVASCGNYTLAAERNFSMEPVKIARDLPYSDGRDFIEQLTLTNLGKTTEFTIEAWDYRYFSEDEITEGKKYGDKEWITSISPNIIELPKNNKVTVNVLFSIPDGTPDAHYEMWLRVAKPDLEEEYPYVITIRTGNAVPSHEYGIYPCIYEIKVEGKGEANRRLNLEVRNTGTSDATYEIVARIPDDPENLNPEYETGNLEWLTINTNKLKIDSHDKKGATFELDIPKNIKTGKYKLWVGVKDITQESSVQIAYACKLLIDVERPESSKFSWFKLWYIPLLILLFISISGIIYKITEKILKIKDRNNE